MINSALEAGIDVATTSFDPLAQLAKDTAGAVRDRDDQRPRRRLPGLRRPHLNTRAPAIDRLRDAPTEITLSHRPNGDPRDRREGLHRAGRPLRGGLPSGHSAIAFGVDGRDLHPGRLDALVPDLDADVHHGVARGADSDRGRFHSFVEVLSGGVLGALVTLVLFQLFWS